MNRHAILGLSVTACAVAAAAALLIPEAGSRLSPFGDSSPPVAPGSAGDAPSIQPAAGIPGGSAAALPAGRAGTFASRPPVAPEQRAAALRVISALAGGATQPGCEASETDLLALATSTPMDSPLWTWAVTRMQDCLRAPTPYRKNSPLLSRMKDLFPDHPRVQQLSGLQSYDQGRIADAAKELEEALGDEGTFESWQTLADSKLTLARQAERAGKLPERDAALAAARDAMERALKLAPPALKPYALHTMARVELEQGHPAEAMQWADQALRAVQDGSGTYQAYMAAEMHVFAGQIYYRSGLRDSGLAYMDQGIALAGSDRQRAELQELRDRFLALYPPG